jgi:LysR family transcriptional regulator, cyn operon transcriptional activator
VNRAQHSLADVELRHLRAFTEVARSSNVSRAAETIGLTQSRVSQQLKELETALDTALFTRVGRRLALTPAGRLFLDHATEVLGSLDVAMRAVGDIPEGEHSHIRVGVVPACNTMFIPAVLGLLHERHPGYTVSVEEGSANDLERETEAGRLDVAVGFLPHASRSLRYRRVLRERFALILRADHPLAKRAILPIGSLQAVELALLPGRFFMRQMIDQILARHRVRPRVQFEVSSLPAIIRTVQEGGIGTILPPFVVPPSEEPSLVTVPLAGRQPAMEIGIMQAPGGGRNAPVERFVELAIEVIERRGGLAAAD